MNGQVIQCNQCQSDKEPFRVPWPMDQAGSALMRTHLLDEHDIDIRGLEP